MHMVGIYNMHMYVRTEMLAQPGEGHLLRVSSGVIARKALHGGGVEIVRHCVAQIHDPGIRHLYIVDYS